MFRRRDLLRMPRRTPRSSARVPRWTCVRRSVPTSRAWRSGDRPPLVTLPPQQERSPDRPHPAAEV